MAEPFFASQLARTLFNISTKWIEPRILKRETKQRTHDLSIGIVGHPLFIKKAEIEAADIIHLHWINSRFIRIKAIQHFNKPIVWTLRDAWPYTGGCHYTTDCERYKTGCGKCPLLGSSNPNDITRKIVLNKKEHLPADIRYIALSNWTAEQARASYLLKDQSVQIILNSIDGRFLSPTLQTKEAIRHEFNLPQDKTIILAGAAKIDSKYKGYTEILPNIPDTHNCHLVTFGRISKSLQSEIKIPATHLGTITSTEQLKKLYHAADLFIAPSTQEAFGKTLAEAGACGLPVICYDIGGPKDIVIDRVTGYRVPVNDSDTFIQKIRSLATHSDTRQEMGKAATQRTHTLFSPTTIAQQHIELYQQLLHSN
jgi:glycosyltransferase involved in cell wall biosynthesis